MPELHKSVPLKHRKAFKFLTDEADIRVIRHGGKLRIIRLIKKIPKRRLDSHPAIKDFCMHSIFNFLFPMFSIKPIAISKITENGERRWGLVSEIVKQRSRDYKAYQKWLYVDKSPLPRPESVKRHEHFVSNAFPTASKIWAAAGIELNTHGVNVANVNGMPIFFEIESIYKPRLKKYIDSMGVKGKAREKLNTWLKHI